MDENKDLNTDNIKEEIKKEEIKEESASEQKTEAETAAENTDAEPKTNQKKKDKTEKKSIGKEILEWVVSIAIAVAAALCFKGFLFEMVKVDGHSMDPTLADGQQLIVRRIAYSPKVGDIIVFDSNYKKRQAYFDKNNIQGISRFTQGIFTPKDYPKVYYVKRVIATEGQTVEITGGDVFVDGEKLDEDYIQGMTYATEADYKTTIEEGCIFVMGDNREHSSDSRVPNVGQVPKEAVLGKAVLRVFPFNKFGGIK